MIGGAVFGAVRCSAALALLDACGRGHLRAQPAADARARARTGDGDLLFFTAVLDKHEEHPDSDAWQVHATGRVINADLQCGHYGVDSATALARIGRMITSHLRPDTSR